METNLIQWNPSINLDNETIFLIFSQVWCPPCKALIPVINEVDKILPKAIKICKIDCEEHPELAHRFGIRSVPTTILVHKGNIIKYNGSRDARSISQWLVDNTN